MEFKPSNESLEPIVLDPQDPEDAEYLRDLSSHEEELRKEYPTKEKAIEAASQGFIPLSNLSVIFSAEEMKYIEGEVAKRAEELEGERKKRSEDLKKMFG